MRALEVRRERARTLFDVSRRGRSEALAVTLNMAGLHNVRNALAAIAVGTELEIEDAAIVRALANFQGIERRMQWLGEVQTARGKIDIVDDYGHHPTEIAATLDALRQSWPGRRLVLAFQPHRYTRTRDLLDDFANVLTGFDELLITEVYAGRRSADQGRRRPGRSAARSAAAASSSRCSCHGSRISPRRCATCCARAMW